MRLQSGQSRSRDLVGRVGVVVVDVVDDTGVVLVVERGGGDTVGEAVARAGDAEVDALRVELSTTDIIGGVEGEDLVAENIVARTDVLGDSDSPGQAIGDELIRSPLSKQSWSA